MTVPASMRAVSIAQPGDPDVLTSIEVETPSPAPGEVLVEVAFAGVNRPDVLQRRGAYRAPADASPLPGLEVSGTIAALGDGVEGWSLGDEVCALCNGGGYAEYVAVPAGQVLPVPSRLALDAAAGVPECFFTVWVNLFEHGHLAPGESVLIHGGSSGIGTVAIQLARAFGATAYATAGTDDKCARCLELGARAAFNYREVDFVEALKEHEEGVDLVLDMVGGDYVPRNLALLRDQGRHVSIAFLRGPRVDLDLWAVMRKRLVLTGSTLRPRTTTEKAAIADALREHVWPKLADGSVAPVLDRRYPLADAAAAHLRMESSAHVGKIILEVKS